jgi:uncharacterized protein
VAIKEEHEEVALLLIESGADVNIPDSDGDTPLVSAMDNQLWDVAECLISKGANITVSQSIIVMTVVEVLRKAKY